MSGPVSIIGGGGFGRALATAAARVGRRVILWSRNPKPWDSDRVHTTADLSEVAESELVFVAVPSMYVGELARQMGAYLDGSHLVVHVSRGLLGDGLETLTQLLRETTPVRRVGALAGPLVAKSLAEGQPGGGVVGSLFPEVATAVREAIGGPTLRIYGTDDVIGVQMASAFVGLVALALGYAQGAGFGPGTLAVLATRGMAESTRVGVHRGAKERTFSGLAGYGDLLAAVAGDDRPEVALGRSLAEGVSLQQAAGQAGAFVESVEIAKQIVAYASRHKLQAPVAAGMARLVAGELSPEQVVAQLMTRPAKRE